MKKERRLSENRRSLLNFWSDELREKLADFFSHEVIAEIVRVSAVDHALAVKLAEKFEAVYHIHVFIACGNRVIVGLLNDIVSRHSVLYSGAECRRTGAEDYGKFGMLLSYNLEEGLVRCKKMLGSRRVEVIIVNKG